MVVLTGMKRIFDSRPLQAQLVVTYECNLACAYCHEYANGAPLVPLEALCRRVDALAALGVFTYDLLGGEPLLHPDIAEVVRHAKYAPLGTRGVGVGRAHGYGFTFQEYVSSANDETVVVVQAEHIDAVNNIETIVQVPGVDAVLVGPYDLSASLGRLGEVAHPEVVSAIERVTQVCQAVHMPLGIFGMSAEAVRPYIERGYSLITVSIDTVLLGNAARQLLAQLRA